MTAREEDAEPGTGRWRHQVTAGTEWVSGRYRTSVERLQESERGEKIVTAGRGGLKKASEAAKTTARKSGQFLEEKTSNLTLREYRSALDEALLEAVAVIVAQDAEIKALQRRIDKIGEAG